MDPEKVCGMDTHLCGTPLYEGTTYDLKTSQCIVPGPVLRKGRVECCLGLVVVVGVCSLRPEALSLKGPRRYS